MLDKVLLSASLVIQPLSAIPVGPSVPMSTIAVPIWAVKDSSIPLFTQIPAKPSYDEKVLKPLYQAQAEAKEAKRLAAEKACADQEGHIENEVCILPPPVIEAPVVDTNDSWSKLRNCESGGNYAENTGNGYYGAYQFDETTWAGYGGYTRPSDAPSTIQDAKAEETYSNRGFTPWPACSAKLGLSGNT